jgi:hypothetical protein
MIGKVFLLILALFLLLGAFSSSISDGIKGWRTEEQVQGAAVSTAVGITSANVTLTADLFQDDTAEVTDITSNVTMDAPVASTYIASTKVLLIGGLTSNAAHSLSITYLADPDNTVMMVLGPFLGFLIIGGLIVALFYGTFKKSRRG